MIRAFIETVSEWLETAIRKLQQPEADENSPHIETVIKDGIIVSEPPHDEEYDANAEAQRKQAELAARYHAHAQELCAKNKREGIWIELMLLGVPISHIKPGVIDGERFHYSFKGEPLSVIVPEWCLEMMSKEDISWRIERKGIHKAFEKMELKPEDIYTLSPPRETQT